MNGFYQFTTKIKDTLNLDPFVNTVTYGDIFQVDLSKQTIFPLSHLVVNNVTKESNIMRFNISILAMDIVDMTKDETTDVFVGNDNTHDIWHTQLKVLDRLTELLRRGSIVSDGYQLDGNPTFEQFTERFENYLAGWTVTFDVLVGNDMTICEVGSSGGTCSPAGYLIKDSAGTTLYNGTIASGEVGTITVEDTRVENSDASYTVSVLAEGSLTLPDITINVVNTSFQLVNTQIVPSVKDATVSVPDAHINIKKLGDGTIASIDVPSGTTANYEVADNAITVNGGSGFTIDATDPLNIILSDGTSTVTPVSVTPNAGSHHVDIVLPAPTTPIGARLLKTGQTVSYQSGDDGTHQSGRLTSFYVLATNNPFGNTNRFTDELGGQTYTKGIMIDWSQASGSTVQGYYFNDGNYRTWTQFITWANSLSITGFTSGWRPVNKLEIETLFDYGASTFAMNYVPLNNKFVINGGSNRYFWCSNSYPNGTGSSFVTDTYNWGFNISSKGNSQQTFAIRTFTVTGTTLS
jgi:hypothetical protein